VSSDDFREDNYVRTVRRSTGKRMAH
jgi:hypothetical protein